VTTVLAQFSDPHLADPAQDPEPLRRFVQALEAVTADHPDVANIVVTGDLTADGRPAEYEAFRDATLRPDLAVHVVPGNHDDRRNLAGVLDHFAGDHDELADGRRPARSDLGDFVLLLLDSLVPGASHGELGEAQLEWLEHQVEAAAGRPHVVALHHPPFPIGVDGIDTVRLRDADALELLLRRHDDVERLLCGHVHRVVARTFGGVLATTCGSTWRSLALDRVPGAPLRSAAPQELALLHVYDGVFTTHVVSAPAGLG